MSHTLSPAVPVKRVGREDGARCLFPSSLLSHAKMTRPISPHSARVFVTTMHAFSAIPSFRFQAFVYQVEVEKCVSLDSVKKRREADDNFKFMEYVVTEIILLFSIF